MDCRILRHVTLKANGYIGCDDSKGYDIDLGHVELTHDWSVKSVLESSAYKHVRDSFREGRLPWPGICNGCDLLSNGGTPVDTLNTRLELLVEPTLACTLSCACCLRKHIIAGGRSTASLDPEILRRFVQSCRTEDILVDQVHYIGWGEPLLHKNFRELFDIVTESAPLANQMVTTAGNVNFRDTVGDAPLQRLVVSCDGAQRDSYAKYRRGGDFDAVIHFMRDCRKYGDPNTFLEWKYILFEFNDSDEEILLAQELAEDIGVDSLLFVITNSKWHSKRYTTEYAKEIPLKSVISSISPCAAMSAAAAIGKLALPNECNCFGYIDTCSISVGGFLTVEGWAYSKSGKYSDRIELLLDGKVCAKTKTNLRRTDVLQVYPTLVGPNGGFFFRIPLPTKVLPKVVQVRIVSDEGEYIVDPAKFT